MHHPTNDIKNPETNRKSTSILPTDPDIYRVPQSSQLITFSHYTRPLKREDVLACLLQAALEVIKETNLAPDARVDREEIRVNSNRVHLMLYPDSRLTWRIWGTTLTGISNWVETYEFLDCDFDIEIFGYRGKFGSGHLSFFDD